MNDTSLLFRLVVALAIGLLIGLERGWRQREEAEGERTAGLRTYTLSALLGALSYLAPLLSTALLVIIGAAPATSRLALCALLIVGGAGLAASAGWRKKSG